MTKLIIDAFQGGLNADALADEAERIAEMLRDGYTSGEVVIEGGRGWWTTEEILSEESSHDEDAAMVSDGND